MFNYDLNDLFDDIPAALLGLIAGRLTSESYDDIQVKGGRAQPLPPPAPKPAKPATPSASRLGAAKKRKRRRGGNADTIQNEKAAKGLLS